MPLFPSFFSVIPTKTGGPKLCKNAIPGGQFNLDKRIVLHNNIFCFFCRFFLFSAAAGPSRLAFSSPAYYNYGQLLKIFETV